MHCAGLDWAAELLVIGQVQFELADYKAAEAGARPALWRLRGRMARTTFDFLNPNLASAPHTVGSEGPRSLTKEFDQPTLNAASTYANAVTFLGAVYFEKGEFEKAIGVMERGELTTRRVFGEASTIYAMNLSGDGLVYDVMGKHDRAASLAQKAVVIHRKNRDWSLAGSTLNQQLALTLLYRDSLDTYLSVGERGT